MIQRTRRNSKMFTTKLFNVTVLIILSLTILDTQIELSELKNSIAQNTGNDYIPTQLECNEIKNTNKIICEKKILLASK